MARQGKGKGSGGNVKDYEVGYGKPPVETRFKPGESGNRKGKKKGQKTLRTVVQTVFQQVVSVRTPNGVRKVTKLEALVEKLMNDALTGNLNAVPQLVRLASGAGLMQEGEAIDAASF